MSDAWDFYFANVHGALASLFVDLGLRNAAPDPDRPWLLWALVFFREPRDDGLSSAEEAPLLHEIEDALTKAVKEAANADLVGRITTAGHRRFYFYGADPVHFESAAARALERFPGYEFETGIKEDPEWSQYLQVLYPAPEEHERIKNRHVIDILEKHGDSLHEARPVNHWAYFKSRADRDAFLERAIGAGFTLCERFDSSKPETPYGLELKRVDSVDWDSINRATGLLLRLAEEVGGEYDGWETSVMKGDGESP